MAGEKSNKKTFAKNEEFPSWKTSQAFQDLSLLKEVFKRDRLPNFQQSEGAECGLACVAMVVNYHGYKIDLTTIRRRFAISLKGVNLKALMDIAEKLGFAARPLRVEIEEINHVKLPAIIHWNMDHFVVLKTIKKNGVIIHDPAQGVRSIPWREFSKSFTGVVLELTPTKDFEKKEEVEKMRLWEMWSHEIGFKSTILQIFLLTIVLQAFTLATPFYSQLVIDEVVGKYDLNLLKILALGFGAFTVINLVTEILRRYIILYFGNILTYQMTINLFRHLLKLKMEYFEKRNIGDVLSRFGSVQPIKEFFKTSLIASIIDGLLAITTLLMMFLYSPLLAAIVLTFLILYLGIRLAFYPIFRQKTQENIIAYAKERTNFIETVRGFSTIKLFAQEGDRQRGWQHKFAEVINVSVQVGKLNILFDSSKAFLFALENILVFYFAAGMIISGDLTVGMLVAFIAYKTQFIQRSTDLVTVLVEFKMLGLHLERISDIAKSEIDTNLSLKEEGEQIREGGIEIKNLSFRYAEFDPFVFKNLNLKIDPGTCVAITGSSGCGKTTLLKIIAGLFTPNSGEILVDGVPLPKISKKEFREKVATVMQDDNLFEGKISDNICFFDPQIDFERVKESAKKAHIHEEIMAMPMGYYSLIGDMGTVLSGGQKQRVMLARALYKKPEILIIDEGSSHLDVKTEKKINEVIKKMKLTRILVAHRSETIAMADVVYEMTGEGLVRLR